MSSIGDIVTLIDKLSTSIKERKFAADLIEIQRLVVRLQSEQFALQESSSKLKFENRELHEEIVRLQRVIAELEQRSVQVQTQFVEHYGALFKRKEGGGFHHAAYCPNCKNSMTIMGMLPVHCTRCEISASFKGHQFESIFRKLT